MKRIYYFFCLLVAPLFGNTQNNFVVSSTGTNPTIQAAIDHAVNIWDDYLTGSERWILENTLFFTPDSDTDVLSFELDIKWDHTKNRAFVSRYSCKSQGIEYFTTKAQAGRPAHDKAQG